MPRYVPPSIRDKGLRQHFIDAGLDYELFSRQVELGSRVGSLRDIIRKPDGSQFSWDWMKRFVTIYWKEKARGGKQ